MLFTYPKFCIKRCIRCVDAWCVGVLKENTGIAGGYVEALLQSPMPPMINADDVSANANFGSIIANFATIIKA